MSQPAAVVEVSAKDLLGHGVVACPNPQMALWSSHPKVRLDLTSGQAVCPYCGTHYQLSDEARAVSHGH